MSEQKPEKLDAPVPNAPPQPDIFSAGSQADMQSLAKQGKLKDVLDGQGAPIPSSFATAETLLGAELEPVQAKPVDQPRQEPRIEKLPNGSTADLDKDGHLQKLTYASGRGYNYEWSQGQLVSIDSFDKTGTVKPWLEKNNDGTWTQFDDKQDQIWKSDLSVNNQGDLKWTHKASEFHKDGDVEIHRTNGSHTTISQADHSWTTKYPDGEERKIVYDEKTNTPCEYWAPKPHNSHWKSDDGLTWNQISADGKSLNKPPMIGKFTADDESGGFAFVNLGDKGHPHVTAYDGTGHLSKDAFDNDSAAPVVAEMVNKYVERLMGGGHHLIRPGQFERDSKNLSLTVDDRIAARVLSSLEKDFLAQKAHTSQSSSIEIAVAFQEMAKETDTGYAKVDEQIKAAMSTQSEHSEAKEDTETG